MSVKHGSLPPISSPRAKRPPGASLLRDADLVPAAIDTKTGKSVPLHRRTMPALSAFVSETDLQLKLADAVSRARLESFHGGMPTSARHASPRSGTQQQQHNSNLNARTAAAATAGQPMRSRLAHQSNNRSQIASSSDHDVPPAAPRRGGASGDGASPRSPQEQRALSPGALSDGGRPASPHQVTSARSPPLPARRRKSSNAAVLEGLHDIIEVLRAERQQEEADDSDAFMPSPRATATNLAKSKTTSASRHAATSSIQLDNQPEPGLLLPPWLKQATRPQLAVFRNIVLQYYLTECAFRDATYAAATAVDLWDPTAAEDDDPRLSKTSTLRPSVPPLCIRVPLHAASATTVLTLRDPGSGRNPSSSSTSKAPSGTWAPSTQESGDGVAPATPLSTSSRLALEPFPGYLLCEDEFLDVLESTGCRVTAIKGGQAASGLEDGDTRQQQEPTTSNTASASTANVPSSTNGGAALEKSSEERVYTVICPPPTTAASVLRWQKKVSRELRKRRDALIEEFRIDNNLHGDQ